MSDQSTASGPLPFLELLRDAGLEQVIADVLQGAGGQPVRLVLAEGVRDQAEGALGLPEVSWCGPSFQSAITPSRLWSSSPSAVSAWCTRVRCACR